MQSRGPHRTPRHRRATTGPRELLRTLLEALVQRHAHMAAPTSVRRFLSRFHDRAGGVAHRHESSPITRPGRREEGVKVK
jgi:hypothetical protein